VFKNKLLKGISGSRTQEMIDLIIGCLFYDAFSVTSLYSVDERVTNE
jgi:hypothetical protein